MEEEGALDRREMSPLQRRAAATRRRIEAARTETAHPKPRGRMFAAPNAPPPSSPGNSPLTVLEDRRNGSPYNVGRTAVYGSGSSDSSLATPSGINTRARMDVRQSARKIQLCTPMSAQWFRCGEHLKHLAEAATLEERAESETRILSSSESVSTSGSDGNVPGSSPLSPAMLAKIRSGHQSWPSHEKSDDKSNSLWDVDDQHVARGIFEEGKLNALLRLLAAHRQLLRQKRAESQNAWDDFIDDTCVATSLTRNELLYKVKKWEVNAGKFILIIVGAIRLTSCFVHRDRVQTRDARGGVGAGGGHACAVEARSRGVAVAGCAVDGGRGARFNGWRIDSRGELISIFYFHTGNLV